MASKKVAKAQKSFEEALWDSANKLRGSVESSEYKHVVLSLIFLKFASDKFEERRQELIDEGKEKYKLVEGAFTIYVQHSGQSKVLAKLRDTLLPKLLSGGLRIPEAEKQLEEVAL